MYLALGSLATYLGLLVHMKRPISSTPQLNILVFFRNACTTRQKKGRFYCLGRNSSKGVYSGPELKVFEMQTGEPGAVGIPL